MTIQPDKQARTKPKAMYSVLLLCGAIGLSITQFAIQMYYVKHGCFARWPYSWDENRYMDYAHYYWQAIATEGLPGLADAYDHRPAYSPTFVLTSLPVLAVTRNPLGLYWHLLFYVLLLDIGAMMIAWRLTRSTTVAALSVLAIHFTTNGIFCGSTLEYGAEAVRYQLNFPLAALTVWLLAVLIQGAHTRCPALWSALLALTVAACLLLRPPMTPMFLVFIAPPLILLFGGFWRFRRNASLSWLLACLLAAAVPVVWHNARILFLVADYVKGAGFCYGGRHAFGAGSWWASVWYYVVHSERASWLFGPAVFAIAALTLRQLPRLRGIAARRLASRSDAFRIVYVNVTLLWFILAAWVLPTLSPAKNSRIGDGFLFLSLVVGISALAKLAIIRGLRGRRELQPQGLGRLVVATCFVLAALLVSRESYGAWRTARTSFTEPETRQIRRAACTAVVRFIHKWQSCRGPRKITIGFAKGVVYPNMHSLRNSAYLQSRNSVDGDKTKALVTVPTLEVSGKVSKPWAGPEFLFVPVYDLKDRVVDSALVGCNQIPDYRASQKLRFSREYYLYETLRVNPRLSIEVFVSHIRRPSDRFEFP